MYGSAFSVMLTSTYAPRTAPMAPGIARMPTTRQSTLPNFQWDAPEARLVPTSAKCTEADAMAAGVPAASRTDVEVTP